MVTTSIRSGKYRWQVQVASTGEGEDYGKYLQGKVKVISRQKVGSVGADFKLTHTPCFENKVERYQGFRGRVSRVSVDPPHLR
jgi:hypothetical protein